MLAAFLPIGDEYFESRTVRVIYLDAMNQKKRIFKSHAKNMFRTNKIYHISMEAKIE